MSSSFGMDAQQVPVGASTDFVRFLLAPPVRILTNYDFRFRVMSLTASASPAGTPRSILMVYLF